MRKEKVRKVQCKRPFYWHRKLTCRLLIGHGGLHRASNGTAFADTVNGPILAKSLGLQSEAKKHLEQRRKERI